MAKALGVTGPARALAGDLFVPYSEQTTGSECSMTCGASQRRSLDEQSLIPKMEQRSKETGHRMPQPSRDVIT